MVGREWAFLLSGAPMRQNNGGGVGGDGRGEANSCSYSLGFVILSFWVIELRRNPRNSLLKKVGNKLPFDAFWASMTGEVPLSTLGYPPIVGIDFS